MKPRHFIPSAMKARPLALGLIAVFLIVYPLSLGPVIRIQILSGSLLARHLQTGRIFFPHFYDPLGSLCDGIPCVQSAMSWYLDLWVGNYPLEKTIIL
jgi:hypothetical protein